MGVAATLLVGEGDWTGVTLGVAVGISVDVPTGVSVAVVVGKGVEGAGVAVSTGGRALAQLPEEHRDGFTQQSASSAQLEPAKSVPSIQILPVELQAPP